MISKAPKAKVLAKHPVMPVETPKKAIAMIAIKKAPIKKIVKAKKKVIAKKK